MALLRNKFNKNNLMIAYKLLNDFLFIEIVFFLLALIGEGILPGTITSHVGFSKIIIAVGITILATFYTGNKAGISLGNSKSNKKTVCALVFILVLLVFVSLIKISIFLNIFISLVAIASGYFIYKSVLDKNDL